MILIDSALEKREAADNPIRVGMVGAGFMARGVALQICNVVPGMELVAISNRNLEGARRAYTEADVDRSDIVEVETVSQLEDAIAAGQPAITDDALLLCRAEGIDAVLEVTGAVEFGAQVALEAIKHGKHIIAMNAELDSALGPILNARAREAGVVLDQHRRRSAGRDHEFVPLRQRHWREARALRQHQGAARPLPQPDDARSLCQAVGPKASHGDFFRRWLENFI